MLAHLLANSEKDDRVRIEGRRRETRQIGEATTKSKRPTAKAAEVLGLAAGLDRQDVFEALVIENAKLFVDLPRQPIALGDQTLGAYEDATGHAPELEEQLAQGMEMLGEVHADRAALHEIHVVVAGSVGNRQTTRDDLRAQAEQHGVDRIAVEVPVEAGILGDGGRIEHAATVAVAVADGNLSCASAHPVAQVERGNGGVGVVDHVESAL